MKLKIPRVIKQWQYASMVEPCFDFQLNTISDGRRFATQDTANYWNKAFYEFGLEPDCVEPMFKNLTGNHFQRPDGSETSIELNPGDAVMYLGCQADHWRDKFEGQECVQLFMHYVRSYGSKSWAYFDKQQQQNPTASIDSIPKTFL